MRGIASALALLAGLTPAVPARSADSRVVAEVLALCVANHADPDKVLSAAEAAGWTKVPATPFGLETGMELSRVKGEGADLLLLKVRSWDRAVDGVGLVRTRTCGVTGHSTSQDRPAESLEALFGRGPTDRIGTTWLWAYEDAADGRRFMPARSEAADRAAAQGAMRTMLTDPTRSNAGVQYAETALIEVTPGQGPSASGLVRR